MLLFVGAAFLSIVVVWWARGGAILLGWHSVAVVDDDDDDGDGVLCSFTISTLVLYIQVYMYMCVVPSVRLCDDSMTVDCLPKKSKTKNLIPSAGLAGWLDFSVFVSISCQRVGALSRSLNGTVISIRRGVCI